MSVEDVGYSASTLTKQSQFAQISGMHTRIVKGIVTRHPEVFPEYVEIDLNAGPGCYNGIVGSPLLYLDAIAVAGIPHRAWFCERSENNADELARNVVIRGGTCGGQVVIVRGDHTKTSPQIAEELSQIDRPLYGLVYADPNGSLLPTSVIRRLVEAPKQSRIDVLAYVSATTYKRVVGAHGGVRLMDDLRRIGRRFIWLRIPERQHQWTFAILTNWPDFPDLRKMGFRLVGTPEGDELAARLNLRKKRLSATGRPFLFTDPTPSTCGTRNSSPSGPKSSAAPVAGASDAESVRQLSLITFDTPGGEPLTLPKT